MSLLDTGNGECGEELGVGDLGVPLRHDAAQAGDGSVPGPRGVPGPGEVWSGMGSDPALHGHTSAHVSRNLLVAQGLDHDWRVLDPVMQSQGVISAPPLYLSLTELVSFPAEFEKTQE